MSLYKIPKGEHRGLPYFGEKYLKSRKIDGFRVHFMIDPDSRFDFEGDKDELDKSKLFGFHLNWLNNTQDAFLIGFNQTSYEDNTWAVAPYVNWDGTYDPKLYEDFSFKAGQFVEVFFEKTGRKEWTGYISIPEDEVWKNYKVKTRIEGFNILWWGPYVRTLKSLWYGGADNAEGQYGGVAPTDILMNVMIETW